MTDPITALRAHGWCVVERRNALHGHQFQWGMQSPPYAMPGRKWAQRQGLTPDQRRAVPPDLITWVERATAARLKLAGKPCGRCTMPPAEALAAQASALVDRLDARIAACYVDHPQLERTCFNRRRADGAPVEAGARACRASPESTKTRRRHPARSTGIAVADQPGR